MNSQLPKNRIFFSERLFLPVVLVVTLLITGLSAYDLHLTKKGTFWGMRVGGSLLVQLSGRVGTTNRIRAAQIQARAALLKLTHTHTMSISDEGLQNDELVRIINTGSRTIRCDAFNLSSPWYRIEVDRGGHWEALPYCVSPGGRVELKPGESLEFPAIIPGGIDRWRVGVSYYELPASNKLTALVDRGMALVGKRVNREERLFGAYSEPHPK